MADQPVAGVVDSDGAWTPRETDLASSCVAGMIRAAGCRDFDEMRRFSIERPDAYWRLMTARLGVVWRKDYGSLCDTSRGEEFPRWFIGGALNWTDMVLRRADDPGFADKPAIIAENEAGGVREASYRELRDLVGRLAAGLSALGVRRGDRVGLLMENGLEASASVLALSYIGAVVVPLFSGFGAEPIVARLGAAGAIGLIATSGFQRRGVFVSTDAVVEEVLARLPGIRTVIRKGGPAEAGHVDWEALAGFSGASVPSETMSPDDPFMVIYTSGTTGAPKGAVHGHGGFPIKIAHDAAQNFDISEDAVFCWPADMGWIAGPLIMCSALLRGATLVCYDGAPDFPDWSRMAKLIERRRVTHFGSAPTLIRGLAAHEELATAADLSSVKLLVTAGENIAPEHFRWFQRHFGRGEVPVINYTGGTEVSGGLLGNVVVKPIRPGGFNAASAGIDLDVVDMSGAPVTDAIGELVIRAPFVGMTQGFWRDEARYLDTYWRTIPGVWVHGDLVLRDATGTWFLMGRSDDTMKIAGKRVGPAEVEEILVEMEGVVEAAVIGAADEAKGQAIVAFVTGPGLRSSPELTRAARERVRERLGKPFAPRAVHVVPELPKTQSSKVMRRMIRGVHAGTPPGDVSSLVNPDSLRRIAAVLEADGRSDAHGSAS